MRKQRADPLLQMKHVEEEFERIREAKKVAESKERAAVAQVMSSYSSLFPDDIKTPRVTFYLYILFLSFISTLIPLIQLME